MKLPVVIAGTILAANSIMAPSIMAPITLPPESNYAPMLVSTKRGTLNCGDTGVRFKVSPKPWSVFTFRLTKPFTATVEAQYPNVKYYDTGYSSFT